MNDSRSHPGRGKREFAAVGGKTPPSSLESPSPPLLGEKVPKADEGAVVLATSAARAPFISWPTRERKSGKCSMHTRPRERDPLIRLRHLLPRARGRRAL